MEGCFEFNFQAHGDGILEGLTSYDPYCMGFHCINELQLSWIKADRRNLSIM